MRWFRQQIAAILAGLGSPLTLFIWMAACSLAVLAGPFGTYATMGWSIRLIYWGSVITLGLVIGLVVRGQLVAWAATLGPARFDLAVSFIVSVALAPAIWALRGGLDPVLAHSDLSLWSITFNTFMIVAGIFVLRRLTGMEQPAGYGRPPPEVPPTPRLLRRLSGDGGSEIMRLSGNDHFVDVATTAGQETLRLRLADAIEEMEPVSGICTHRSHWVALAAITGMERENGEKLFVRLRNGDRVPVSRRYRPLLEAAGWVEGDLGNQER